MNFNFIDTNDAFRFAETKMNTSHLPMLEAKVKEYQQLCNKYITLDINKAMEFACKKQFCNEAIARFKEQQH